MKIVISSIGSRGDIQPIVALATTLQSSGHVVTLCVPPNFKPFVETHGIACVPVGPDVQKWTASLGAQPGAKQPSKEQIRKMAMAGLKGVVQDQFKVLRETAQGCDLIVVAGGVQSAGSSIAELYAIPYVYATYCPVTLPSPAHPPPMIRNQNLPGLVNRLLWIASGYSWNKIYRAAVNTERKVLGLPPVPDIPSMVTTAHPLVAADAALAPAAPSSRLQFTQTGAWLLPDSTPLPDELERFLAAGEAPVYIGFGSMRANPQANALLIQVARACGRRVIVSKGWGNLDLVDAGTDCIAIGEVAHAQLFPRVAAVVHHGGAGTTTAAALAGVPQVIVPHLYDQFYWAHRIQQLGIGVGGPKVGKLTAPVMKKVLARCLSADCRLAAATFAPRVERHGVQRAAELLVKKIA